MTVSRHRKGHLLQADGYQLVLEFKTTQTKTMTSIYRCFPEGVNDKQWFADMITVPVRVSTEASFRISLSDMRNRDEKDAIIDQLYREFNRRVSSVDPETYKSEGVMARLVARKS